MTFIVHKYIVTVRVVDPSHLLQIRILLFIVTDIIRFPTHLDIWIRTVLFFLQNKKILHMWHQGRKNTGWVYRVISIPVMLCLSFLLMLLLAAVGPPLSGWMRVRREKGWGGSQGNRLRPAILPIGRSFVE